MDGRWASADDPGARCGLTELFVVGVLAPQVLHEVLLGGRVVHTATGLLELNRFTLTNACSLSSPDTAPVCSPLRTRLNLAARLRTMVARGQTFP
jgi:hypothetical protein